MSVAERYVEDALMVEKDEAVSALWRVILRDSGWLIDRIRGFAPSTDNVQRLLASQERGDRELAFRTLVRNRVSYGGILAAGASVVRGRRERPGRVLPLVPADAGAAHCCNLGNGAQAGSRAGRRHGRDPAPAQVPAHGLFH